MATWASSRSTAGRPPSSRWRIPSSPRSIVRVTNHRSWRPTRSESGYVCCIVIIVIEKHEIHSQHPHPTWVRHLRGAHAKDNLPLQEGQTALHEHAVRVALHAALPAHPQEGRCGVVANLQDQHWQSSTDMHGIHDRNSRWLSWAVRRSWTISTTLGGPLSTPSTPK